MAGINYKYMNIIRSINKPVTRILFITLGTMWLSFAIAPCLLIVAVEKNSHDCCPAAIKTGTHASGQKQCDTCYKAQTPLKSTNQFVLSSTNSGSNFNPGIIERNYIQASESPKSTYIIPVNQFQTLPPPLRFRILLI